MRGRTMIMIGILLCILMVGIVPPPLAAQEKPAQIVSVRVEKAPAIDGEANDDAWKKSKAVQITVKRVLDPERGKSTRVWLRSVHTDTHIYFLAVWEDDSESISHRTWAWNPEKKAYEDAGDREDMFSLAFEHTGELDANMLSGVEKIGRAFV